MLRPTSRIAVSRARRADARHAGRRASGCRPAYTMVATLPSITTATGVRRCDTTRQEPPVRGASEWFVLARFVGEDAARQGPIRAQEHRQDRVRARGREDLLHDRRRSGLRGSRPLRREQDAHGRSDAESTSCTSPRARSSTSRRATTADRVRRRLWPRRRRRAAPGMVRDRSSRPFPAVSSLMLADKQGAVHDRRRDAPDRGVARDRTTDHAGVSRGRSGRRVSVRRVRSRVRRHRHQTRRRHRQRCHAERFRASRSIPASVVLLATWHDDDPPPYKIRTYRPGPDGLTEIARLENPRIGISGVEPTNHGFVQQDISRCSCGRRSRVKCSNSPPRIGRNRPKATLGTRPAGGIDLAVHRGN